ncbi:MAG: phage portal protein [Candidatus Ornithomonoglobus sp.]
MSILSSLFRSRDKPTNSTAGSSYRFFMGNSSSGKRVNERTAMQMTAVYACVRILAESVAGLPLHLYRYTDSGGKEKATDHPLYFLLHDEPNPEMTSFVFRETLMTHLLLWGNAYAQIVRNGKGEILGLYPLMPDRMTVDRDSSGRLYYRYNASSDEAPETGRGEVILTPADVFHIPGLGFDGLVGYSPIAMAKNAIGMAIACEEYGARFFQNGATPGGIIEHPGKLTDPAAVRDSWNQSFGGSVNSGKVAVLEEGMKYTPISISPKFIDAVSVSATYAVLSRCGFDPGEYFEHEDFLSIFDFNTVDTISELGTATSEINQQILRSIEITIKNYERAKLAERTENYDRTDLHEERRLLSSEPHLSPNGSDLSGCITLLGDTSKIGQRCTKSIVLIILRPLSISLNC